MNKRPAIIFDIDGTIADCKHRRHYVEGKKKDWDSFYKEVGNDNPKWNTIDFLVNIAGSKPDYDMLFVSGRPERTRQDTLDWFKRLLLFQPAHLFMRPDGDHCPDDELKKRIYLEKIEPKFDVKLVLDDRDRVVKMWRSLGLECWQVAEGNF